jgi:hypothetical protein
MVAQEQFRRNTAPLYCSLHRSHSFKQGIVWQGLCNHKRGGVQGGRSPPWITDSFQCRYSLQVAKTRNGCTGAVQKEYSPLVLLAAQVTQLQTRYSMTGTVQTQERGVAGGAQPPLNCLTHLNVALHCKDQALKSPNRVLLQCHQIPNLVHLVYRMRATSKLMPAPQ